jgi:hypothetical protein
MKSRWVMLASAVFMAALGLIGTFLPHELLAKLHVQENAVLALVIQLAGALYIAFAMLNWTAKDSLIGGIYNRPALLGNVLHFTAGAMALIKGAFAGHGDPSVIAGASIYALFALAFGNLMFTSPVKSGE